MHPSPARADYFAAFCTDVVLVPKDLPVAAQPSVVAIQTQAVRKCYQIGRERTWVLNGIDLEIGVGQCVFLSGPSGSGKSTLLSILGCLLAPDDGQIFIHGQRVDQLNQQQRTILRRDTFGFVFQRFQLIRGLSALDNVALPLTLQGERMDRAREKAADLLCQVGLQQHVRALPTAMSPGQCQRVALARAVITKPKLILADEPTAALDATSGIEVMELLKQLIATSAATAVVVTHDPRIYGYADRICEMEEGRLKQ